VVVNELCPAFTELVQDEHTGLYANKKNLHLQLSRLLQEDKYSSYLGKNGYHSSSNYFWSKIASHINTHLLGFVNEKTSLTPKL